MEFTEIGERLGDAIKKEASVYYTRTNERNEDVERVMRSVSDNAQHYAMYSRELDLLLSALRTIYPQQ